MKVLLLFAFIASLFSVFRDFIDTDWKWENKILFSLILCISAFIPLFINIIVFLNSDNNLWKTFVYEVYRLFLFDFFNSYIIKKNCRNLGYNCNQSLSDKAVHFGGKCYTMCKLSDANNFINARHKKILRAKMNFVCEKRIVTEGSSEVKLTYKLRDFLCLLGQDFASPDIESNVEEVQSLGVGRDLDLVLFMLRNLRGCTLSNFRNINGVIKFGYKKPSYTEETWVNINDFYIVLSVSGYEVVDLSFTDYRYENIDCPSGIKNGNYNYSKSEMFLDFYLVIIRSVLIVPLLFSGFMIRVFLLIFLMPFTFCLEGPELSFLEIVKLLWSESFGKEWTPLSTRNKGINPNSRFIESELSTSKTRKKLNYGKIDFSIGKRKEIIKSFNNKNLGGFSLKNENVVNISETINIGELNVTVSMSFVCISYEGKILWFRKIKFGFKRVMKLIFVLKKWSEKMEFGLININEVKKTKNKSYILHCMNIEEVLDLIENEVEEEITVVEIDLEPYRYRVEGKEDENIKLITDLSIKTISQLIHKDNSKIILDIISETLLDRKFDELSGGSEIKLILFSVECFLKMNSGILISRNLKSFLSKDKGSSKDSKDSGNLLKIENLNKRIRGLITDINYFFNLIGYGSITYVPNRTRVSDSSVDKCRKSCYLWDNPNFTRCNFNEFLSKVVELPVNIALKLFREKNNFGSGSGDRVNKKEEEREKKKKENNEESKTEIERSDTFIDKNLKVGGLKSDLNKKIKELTRRMDSKKETTWCQTLTRDKMCKAYKDVKKLEAKEEKKMKSSSSSSEDKPKNSSLINEAIGIFDNFNEEGKKFRMNVALNYRKAIYSGLEELSKDSNISKCDKIIIESIKERTREGKSSRDYVKTNLKGKKAEGTSDDEFEWFTVGSGKGRKKSGSQKSNKSGNKLMKPDAAINKSNHIFSIKFFCNKKSMNFYNYVRDNNGDNLSGYKGSYYAPLMAVIGNMEENKEEKEEENEKEKEEKNNKGKNNKSGENIVVSNQTLNKKVKKEEEEGDEERERKRKAEELRLKNEEIFKEQRRIRMEKNLRLEMEEDRMIKDNEERERKEEIERIKKMKQEEDIRNLNLKRIIKMREINRAEEESRKRIEDERIKNEKETLSLKNRNRMEENSSKKAEERLARRFEESIQKEKKKIQREQAKKDKIKELEEARIRKESKR